MRALSIVVLISMITSCNTPKYESVVTIVNIGESDRLSLGRQLQALRNYSPKIIALDFFLVPDSLDKDSVLVKEMAEIENDAQIVGLHQFRKDENEWQIAEVSHSKFQVKTKGFAYLSIEDSVVLPEIPLVQMCQSRRIHAFSYTVAENSYGVKEKYSNAEISPAKFPIERIGKYTLIQANNLITRKVDPKDIDGRIVLLGYIGPNEDYFYYDTSKKRKINGVEVHAAIVDELVHAP